MTRLKLSINQRLSAFISILTLLLPTAAFAQENFSATVSASRDILTVGDPVELTITVVHPADYRAELAVVDWGDFEVLFQPAAMPTSSGSTLRANVTLWAPGSYELPPLPITLTTESGQSQTIVTEPITFTVTSVLIDGDRKLRDIRPQASLPQRPFWLLWLLLVVGLVVGGTAVWRARQATPTSEPAIISAQEEALAALAALAEPQPGKLAAFATAVLHILRRFLQQTTPIPMDYRTTAELADALPQTALPAQQQAEIIALLQQIDALRFRPQPTQLSAAALIEPTRRIITHPGEEAAA